MMLFRQHRAFTLIEMLVVLVIVAIVTTVAVLALSGRAGEREIRSTANQFISIVAAASSEATLLPGIVGIKISHDGYQLYVFDLGRRGMAGEWKPMQQQRISGMHSFRSGVIVSVVKPVATHHGNSAPQIILYPSGLSSSAQLKVTNRHDKIIYTVTINTAAAVSVEHQQ